MIVTLEQFQRYTNVFTDNEELQKSYIYSATDIVTDYLSYNPRYKILNTSGELDDVINIDDIPEIIKLTVMRIGALLQVEGDSNIGVTSKQFSEGGSRTFINTTDFFKYLIQLSKYRKIRI